MKLKDFSDFKLGNTPIHKVSRYCPTNNLYIKLESYNLLGSIKDRTAYYIIKDLIETKRLRPGVQLVESSSGNLGIALAYFSQQVGIRFLCLVDPSIVPEKIHDLESAGVEINIVSLGDNPDYRSARIKMAQELDQQPDWIWTNQYDNLANFRAHYETTGPEIWTQTKGRIDYIVCTVGTGGTICGIGQYLKQRKPEIRVVAVEPKGSTIFGGESGEYLSAGAGMRYPSGIFQKYGRIVDYYCKVKDSDALQACVNIIDAENFSVGVTTGSALVAASSIALSFPDKNIVVISPDNGKSYTKYTQNILPLVTRNDVDLLPYVSTN